MMATWTDQPVFCFSSDIDWASEAVIRFSHAAVGGDELRLTYFNTHESPALREIEARGAARLLIHPNFLPGSSHGEGFEAVMEFCRALQPDADGFRSHRYFEVNDILDSYAARGFRFVSNHCTRCELGLRPLLHRSGMYSLPIFLEDGGYLLMDPDLDFDSLRPRLLAPGLKLINFHPAHMAFNTPDFGYTRRIKDRLSREAWNEMGEAEIAQVEHGGNGVRVIIQRIVELALGGGHPIMSMHEVVAEASQSGG